MLDNPRAATRRDRSSNDPFVHGLLAYRGNLKAFACSLARNPDIADELVQETVERALAHRDKFDCRTNQRAWLFTILKNVFRSRKRRESRETELTEGIANRLLLTASDTQENALFLTEVRRAVRKLPAAQMRAILLVGAGGHSIEEAAMRENCAPGTIKSRVSRGRSTLVRMTIQQ